MEHVICVYEVSSKHRRHHNTQSLFQRKHTNGSKSIIINMKILNIRSPHTEVVNDRDRKCFRSFLLNFMYVFICATNWRWKRHNIMSCKELKALPTHIFTSPPDDKGTSKTCVVCLEDYIVGGKLHLLPCLHSKLFKCSWNIFI